MYHYSAQASYNTALISAKKRAKLRSVFRLLKDIKDVCFLKATEQNGVVI